MRLIINRDSSIDDLTALTRVASVVNQGKISETKQGKLYCFASTFTDGTVVECSHNKTGYSFRVYQGHENTNTHNNEENNNDQNTPD